MISEIGRVWRFAASLFWLFVRHRVPMRACIEQVYLAGVRSIPLTVTTGAFVGAILAIQIQVQLRDFGAEGYLGGLSTSVTIRNVGPVLIAFLLSGKVGAYTSAELASMQVTDQISAIRCLGLDPLRFLVLPRLIGVLVSSSLLLIVGLMTAVFGGIAIASLQLGVNPQQFVSNIPQVVTGWSIGTGVLKSIVYGAILAVICCYRGYTASGGAAGVGRTVRSSSVQTLLSILVADFVLSTFSESLRAWLE
jgi:phospholipid/cholesterol/gamma-HCH transport system permease protein